MHSHVNFLLKKGYFALTFDPPGTWDSNGDISLYNMTNYIQAIDEVIEYFGNRPTLLLGHSRGGSVAIIAGIKNPYVTGFVSIMSSYTYNPDITENYPNSEWKKKGYKIHKRTNPAYPNQTKMFYLPYSFLEDEIKYDMTNELRNCPKPKLFIYGINDITVEPEIIQKGYEISKEPKEIYAIKSEHNYFASRYLIDEVNEIIGKFISSHKNI